MVYIDWNRVFRSAFSYWIEQQYLWCIEVQTDTSIVSQLFRHYREQFILRGELCQKQ